MDCDRDRSNRTAPLSLRPGDIDHPWRMPSLSDRVAGALWASTIALPEPLHGCLPRTKSQNVGNSQAIRVTQYHVPQGTSRPDESTGWDPPETKKEPSTGTADGRLWKGPAAHHRQTAKHARR